MIIKEYGNDMDEKIINDLLNFIESEYQITSCLVESGQRIVYLAKNVNFPDKQCVLKTSPTYPSSVARIQRELKILDEINSEYFPKSLHSTFLSNEDIKYYIDNIDPKTEKEKIDTLLSLNIRPMFITVEEYIPHLDFNIYSKILKEEKNLKIYLQHVFKALNLLWVKKIVHRDLKPDNILLRENMIPVIIDLGIAKSMREGTNVLTHPLFASPCTPQYAAPEQLLNYKTEVTYKSDQFAIGIFAYYLLTGKYPFGKHAELGDEAYTENVMNNNLEDIQKLNNNISDQMSNFLHRLLNIQPYKRFRNYNEIVFELERIGD